MKSTVFVSLVAIGAQLVCGSPFSTRALGGTVVIRQSAENGDAFVDTTVTIDLEGDRIPQALKGLSDRSTPPHAMLTFLVRQFSPKGPNLYRQSRPRRTPRTSLATIPAAIEAKATVTRSPAGRRR
jgi:hypothetical protein